MPPTKPAVSTYRRWLNLYHAALKCGIDDDTAARWAFAVVYGG